MKKAADSYIGFLFLDLVSGVMMNVYTHGWLEDAEEEKKKQPLWRKQTASGIPWPGPVILRHRGFSFPSHHI